jgi:hypothetical protein
MFRPSFVTIFREFITQVYVYSYNTTVSLVNGKIQIEEYNICIYNIGNAVGEIYT